MRQLLAEGVSLWAVASAVGVVLAYALIRLLLAYGPRALPRTDEVSLNLRGYVTAAAFMLLVAALAAYVPARRAAAVNAITALREE